MALELWIVFVIKIFHGGIRCMPAGLLCVMFSCVFVTFPYGVPGQVRYLIVLIPDLCLVLYFSKL